MPRTKAQIQDVFALFDRIPEKERYVVVAQNTFRHIANFYGFEPMGLSLFDHPRMTNLLQRAGFFGEKIPVSAKTKNGIEFLLNPTGVMRLLRSYVSHRMSEHPHPLKLSFQNDSFFVSSGNRAALLKQSEWGLCVIGDDNPSAEAVVVHMLWRMFGEVGLGEGGLECRMNAVGCSDCRPQFRSAFVGYFRSRINRMCKKCRQEFKRFPTRMLACQEEDCRAFAANAPQVLDFLCEMCKKHLRGVLEFLDEARVPYFLDARFFRDGSWFERIIFEYAYTVSLPQAEGKAIREERRLISEGGRISRLTELLVGRKLEGTAGIVMVDALADILVSRNTTGSQGMPLVFLVQLGDLAKRKSLNLLEMLRRGGIAVRESLGRDSIKAQLKMAERIGAQSALILGQKEALDGTIIIREVSSGIQEILSQEKLVEFLKKKLKQ